MWLPIVVIVSATVLAVAVTVLATVFAVFVTVLIVEEIPLSRGVIEVGVEGEVVVVDVVDVDVVVALVIDGMKSS